MVGYIADAPNVAFYLGIAEAPLQASDMSNYLPYPDMEFC